jgi:hypothetical protein
MRENENGKKKMARRRIEMACEYIIFDKRGERESATRFFHSWWKDIYI